MKELWALFISAQANGQGIPTEFLEAKKEELRQKKVRLFSNMQYPWSALRKCGVPCCLAICRWALNYLPYNTVVVRLLLHGPSMRAKLFRKMKVECAAWRYIVGRWTA